MKMKKIGTTGVHISLAPPYIHQWEYIDDCEDVFLSVECYIFKIH